MESKGMKHIACTIKHSFLGIHPLPDATWEFYSDTKLEVLQNLFRRVTDAHVVSETLRYAEDYTGSRL
jgi:hypothetical protein